MEIKPNKVLFELYFDIFLTMHEGTFPIGAGIYLSLFRIINMLDKHYK